jgi:hypothetical protein
VTVIPRHLGAADQTQLARRFQLCQPLFHLPPCWELRHWPRSRQPRPGRGATEAALLEWRIVGRFQTDQSLVYDATLNL